MDFRSQLSAFQKSGSSNNISSGDQGRRSERGNSSNDNRNRKRSYSPNRDHYDGHRDHRRRTTNHHHHQGYSTSQRRRFNPSQDLDGLGDLRNFGYRIPRGFPPPPTEEERKKQSKHIAMLVLTIDDLPYEHIWKNWCKNFSSNSDLNDNDNVNKDGIENKDGDDDEYFISIVCHAKHPQNVKSDWLRRHMLTFPPKLGRGNSFSDPTYLSRMPSWGSVEITRAMLDLLQDGLRIGNKDVKQYDDERFDASRYLVRFPSSFKKEGDTTISDIPPVDKFLFVSESCLPVVTPRELFSRISDPTISWLNSSHRLQDTVPKNKYEDDQFAGINRRIPGQYRWKGDQWVLLSRTHASRIIALDRPHVPPKHQLWQSFRHINASDEMFFPTSLALLGYLRFTQNGLDTQKGRSRDEESSSQSGERGNLSSTNSRVPPSPKNASSNDDAQSTTSTSTSSLPNTNDSIILKPVTYTDWSEGMKNPALYTRGETDFKRVSKLARDKGCLLARKFATHVSVPGISSKAQKITGELSMKQWVFVINELQEEEAKSAAPPPSEEKGECVAKNGKTHCTATTKDDKDDAN